MNLNRIFSCLRLIRPIKKMSTLAAVCQMTSTGDIDKNLLMGEELISKAVHEHRASMVFLPECFDFLAPSPQETIKLSQPIDQSPIIKKYQSLALEHSVWLSLGGFHEKVNIDDEKVFMSHVIINNIGEVVSVYRKAHLFNYASPGSTVLTESDYVNAGNEIPSPVETPIGKVAPLICYDVRFPAISSRCVETGATCLTYPSAFTVPTGRAHWHILLRARAIENQCYVIAAAQCGKHNEKRSTFGHSLIVDPWGTLLTDLKDVTLGVGVAEIKIDLLKEIRKAMPILKHKRHDLYH